MAKGSSKPETVGTDGEAAQPGQAGDQPDKLIEELREATEFATIFSRLPRMNCAIR
jgi:hypothetical protein